MLGKFKNPVYFKRLSLIVLFLLPPIYTILWGRYNPYFDEIIKGAIILLGMLLTFGIAVLLFEVVLATVKWLVK